MGDAKSIGTAVLRIALAGGFVGLGLLGIALISLAVAYPTSAGIPERIVVVILGLGGIGIAIGYVQTVRSGSRLGAG